MFELMKFNLLLELLALGVGVLTGWWAWARVKPVAVRSAVSAPVELQPTAADTAPVAVATQASIAPLAKPNIAAAVGEADDLQKIKGIGPKLSELCHSLGVSRFDQIASWSAADIAEVDHHLVGFHGRIERDQWIAQAALLAKGDFQSHAAQFPMKGSE